MTLLLYSGVRKYGTKVRCVDVALFDDGRKPEAAQSRLTDVATTLLQCVYSGRAGDASR